MYILETRESFDSAHFLPNYEGKCGNIHGHRWTVVVQVQNSKLIGKEDPQNEGFVVDFGTLKKQLKEELDQLDHRLIIEKGSIDDATLNTIAVFYDFDTVQCPFRPTAENFSKFFYDVMKGYGYNVRLVEVYETPNNKAIYIPEV